MKLHANARTTPRSRLVMVRRVEEEGWTAEDVAESFSVSVRTVYRWVKRYREGGEAALVERTSRLLNESSEDAERGWKRESSRSGDGEELGDRSQLSRLGRTRRSVQLLRRHGVHRLKLLDPDEPVTRYEKDLPGELLHLDTKKLGRIKGIGHRITGDRQL